MSPASLPAVETSDFCTLAQARRVAAMLDLDPQILNEGDPLPQGWHFAMLAGETPRRLLRSDGFPGLGIPMRQMDRQRLLLGQRETSFAGPVFVGAPIRRKSKIESVTEKTGRNGPLSIVRIQHELLTPDDQDREAPSIVETQTYYLVGLVARRNDAAQPIPKHEPPSSPAAGAVRVVTPDDVMLFQYSALGFNTHRIHFDRNYATRVEGHPDLVVNGGLATLLATEYVRTELCRALSTVSARHLAPLYVNRPMTILAPDVTDAGATISLLDSDGTVAVELTMTFHEL